MITFASNEFKESEKKQQRRTTTHTHIRCIIYLCACVGKIADMLSLGHCFRIADYVTPSPVLSNFIFRNDIIVTCTEGWTETINDRLQQQ